MTFYSIIKQSFLILPKLRKIESGQVIGRYNKEKLIELLHKIFDASNPNFTQFSNPKTFQIRFFENTFLIKKIDKIRDSSDPTYMALTCIRGHLTEEGEYVKINLIAEIDAVWFYLKLFGIAFSIVSMIMGYSQFIALGLLTLMIYFISRSFAKADFYRFRNYFQDELFIIRISENQ